MARIVLKDPSAPSVKKTTKPPSLKYKTYFYRMVAMNIILIISVLYLINREQVDGVLLPILNNLNMYL